MAWQLDNDRPIYTQLVERIKLGIIAGKFRPGDKMPSVRELAQDAGVNPNTMQKAFSELERTGLVQTFRTSGRVVTEDVDKIKGIKMEIAKEMVENFFKQMQELGYNKEETIELFRETCEEGK